MKLIALLSICILLISVQPLNAQTGPWAKYNGKMKGEALIREADGGYLKEVQSIVEGGGDVNWQMEGSGLTPLMAASSAGYIEIVKFLLANGADPDLKDSNGRTAQDRAKMSGANDVVRFLSTALQQNNVAADNDQNQTLQTEPSGPWAKYNGKMKGEALIRDADGGYLEEVKSIVQGGGDVNWQMEGSGLTPLIAASVAGNIEIVKFLLASGANPDLKDANGRTALERATLAGAKDVVKLLQQVNGNRQRIEEAPQTDTRAPQPEEPAVNTMPVNNIMPTGSASGWAPFGTYKAGSQVKFFAGSWKTGTIVEVGARGDYNVKNAAPGERKYLIARDGVANWTDWTDWGNVTGLTREPYWTSFFTGNWRLGETMAVNTRTEGVYQRDEYTFHGASESLVVNANNTYKWKTIDGKILTGSWKPAGDGAGIILLKAFQGLNWTLRNETNAAEENIRGLQSARLTTDGKMSITAKRPIR